MPMPDDLSNRWAVMGPTSGHELLTTSVIDTESGQRVRMGVDRRGFRHLLIAIDAGDRKIPDDIVGALVLTRRSYKFGDETSQFLDIECVRADLFDLFDELLRGVIGAVGSGGGSDAAIEVVDRWRTLLASRGRQRLSESAQRGLAAELLVLFMVSPTGAIDVECWRGPLSEPHDILLPDRALEVKSIGAQSRNVEIHGSAQLAPPGKPLALVLVQLVEGSEGESIPDLANHLLHNSIDRALALSRLSLVGYSAVDSDNYSTRFRIGELLFADVDERFPRIVPNSFVGGIVPDEISYLTYGLTLSALKPHLKTGRTALIDWVDVGAQH